MSKRKAGPEENNLNSDFCNFLLELADYEKNVSRNIFKHKAYRKAASVLGAHPTRIRSGEEALRLPGVGSKIAKKIDEFLETGKLAKLDKIHEDGQSTVVNLLTQVSGIGPVKAQELYRSGIENIEDLRKHSDKLTHHQQIGLKFYEDFLKKIPRCEAGQMEEVLIKIIKEVNELFKITICGSYRRGKSECGDIDVLVTHPLYTSEDNKKAKTKLLEEIVVALEKCNFVTDRLSLGSTKFMGACRLNGDLPTRRIDIRLIPYDHYYCCVLYFTGSDLFNREMRAHAWEVGFILNEYSLRPVGSTGVPGEPLQVTSEEDIFDFIGYPYKKPSERSK